MALDINTLIADYNGAVYAQAGVVEWGYIPAEWFLALPQGVALFQDAQTPDAPTPNVPLPNMNAAATTVFMKAQYNRIRPMVESNEEALWVSTLRFHCMQRGLFCKVVGRRIREDEYSVEPPKDGDWAHANNNIPNVPRARDITKWIKRFGNAVLHSVALAFTSRGHHYKQEYKEYYERLMAVQGVDMKPSFNLPSFEIIFRLSLHCFGVRPLIELALEDKRQNIMSAPMSIRWTPHAPIAGVAHITTTKAALIEMNKEGWFGAFATKYAADITALNDEVTAIGTNPYDYHVSTAFITANARRYVSAQGIAAFTKLSQLALGYIDFLGKKHSLAGEKAITSHSGGMGSLATQFSKACQKYSAGDFTAATMKEWLATV